MTSCARGAISPPRLLVLWEEGPLGQREAAQALRQIGSLNCSARLCLRAELPAPALSTAPRWEDDAQTLALEQTALLLPMLSLATLGRIEQADFSDPFVVVILSALCGGIRVAVLRSAVDPRFGKAASALLSQKIEHRISLLRSLGMELTEDLSDLFEPKKSEIEVRERKPGQILTERDLLEGIESGRSEWRLNPGDRLTPLALDLVRQRNLKVIF